MKIAFLLTQDIESPSGLGRYFPIAQQLSGSGHCVWIIGLHPCFDTLDERSFRLDGVHIDYVSSMHVRKEGSSKQYYSPGRLVWLSLRAFIQIARKAIQVRPDLYVIGKPHPMNSLGGLLSRWILGGKMILDCDDIETHSNRFQGRWQQIIIGLFEKYMPRLVDRVTTNTHYAYNYLLALGTSPEKVFYLPNGVDLDRFAPSTEAELDKARLMGNIPPAKDVVAYIGSLSLVNHSVDLLLHAFKTVHDCKPATHLLVVGGGEDLSILKALSADLGLENDVTFTGRIAPGAVRHFYSLSKVSVDPVADTPAMRARCPLKLFESWACGVPVVTGDVGDRGLFIKESGAGVLVEPGNAQSLAEGILRVLSDPEIARAARLAGFEQAAGFTWEQILTRQSGIFDISSFGRKQAVQ